MIHMCNLNLKSKSQSIKRRSQKITENLIRDGMLIMLINLLMKQIFWLKPLIIWTLVGKLIYVSFKNIMLVMIPNNVKQQSLFKRLLKHSVLNKISQKLIKKPICTLKCMKMQTISLIKNFRKNGTGETSTESTSLINTEIKRLVDHATQYHSLKL